jgi:UDP-N-acetyl-D-mannosaminuronic acid dehydrogenase
VTGKKYSTFCIIGLGYIGLPTASVLASSGVQVHGVDINALLVDQVNQGIAVIPEPDLNEILSRVVIAGRLRASLTPVAADVFVIAVPTPFKDNHEPDLSFVEAAVRSIAPHLQKGSLVVLESTCPVGATETMARWLKEERPDLHFPTRNGSAGDVSLAYCPERVLPGHIVEELINNDRIIGGMTTACAEAAEKMYRHFVKGECFLTDCRTAELAKLAENSYRDVNIAFANELSMLAENFDVDAWELIRLANRHPRVKILSPGPGVGGHCIAVDPWFLVHAAPELTPLIRTAREVNNGKVHYVVKKIVQACQEFTSREGRLPAVAFLGLAFKANVDDLRESPAIEVVHETLLHVPCHGLIVEPFKAGIPSPLDKFNNLEERDLSHALTEADIVVGLVDHASFQRVPTDALKGKKIMDFKGIWPALRTRTEVAQLTNAV